MKKDQAIMKITSGKVTPDISVNPMRSESSRRTPLSERMADDDTLVEITMLDEDSMSDKRSSILVTEND